MKPGRMRLLILEISDRCDQRCVHCQIWSGPGRTGLTLDERLRVVDEAAAAGAVDALLTGGEPLLSADLWPVAERLKVHGLRTMLATNGRLLSEHAASVARLIDEVYVSLDGDAATHDSVRGVPSYARVADGIAAVRRLGATTRWVARSTVHARNIGRFRETVAAARALGVDHVSFLPLDAGSDAFGGDPAPRAALRPTSGEVRRYLEAIDQAELFDDGFVLESPEKLRRLGRHLEAGAGRRAFERPPCDAPAWSSVVTVDGSLRPCFFHPGVGDVRSGLGALRGSSAYREALGRIDKPNRTCDGCVCPKVASRGLLERALSRAATLVGARAS